MAPPDRADLIAYLMEENRRLAEEVNRLKAPRSGPVGPSPITGSGVQPPRMPQFIPNPGPTVQPPRQYRSAADEALLRETILESMELSSALTEIIRVGIKVSSGKLSHSDAVPRMIHIAMKAKRRRSDAR